MARLNLGKQTKANAAANAKVKDAERRAKRKMQRLRRKGVLTGSINPLESVPSNDTWALKAYANRLEKFISRDTRYVAGYEGTPIPYADYRDYKRVEREWNREHRKTWEKFASKPFYTGAGESGMSVSQAREIGKLERRLIEYERSADPSSFKSVAHLRKRMERLRAEMTGEYRDRRIDTLRENMVRAAQTSNDDVLASSIEDLSPTQLQALYEQTDFVERLMGSYEWMKSTGIPGKATVKRIMEEHEEHENLRNLVEMISSKVE